MTGYCMLKRSSKRTPMITDHEPVMKSAVVRIGRLEPEFPPADLYFQAVALWIIDLCKVDS